MLDFSDQPYRFFPSRFHGLVVAVARQMNKRFVLPGKKHRIQQIRLRNAERVLPMIQSGSRCLLLPNHSTHSDPQIMMEVQRRLGVDVATMAAYDVFLRGRLQAWFMQSIGCFSVDREGSDSQSMRCAIDILVKGARSLVVFPEGNVFLMNDRTMPFLVGSAFLAMRAQKKLGKEQPIHALPISIKLSHLTDCRAPLTRHVVDLESRVGIEPDDQASLRRRLRGIGLQVLGRNLRHRGYLPPASEGEDLHPLLESSAVQIISRLESKMELSVPENEAPIERVRRIRSAIHQVRIDHQQQFDHRVAATWADEAILAARILSYSADYLQESSTLDRHGETLEKLREDLTEKMVLPIGDRRAVVQFGDPIDLTDHLDAMRDNSKKTLSDLTRQFERSVQRGLDEINASNDLPGAELLEGPAP